MKAQLTHYAAQAAVIATQVSKDLKEVKRFASDGCTGVPDFIFGDCCKNHDFGYEFGSEMGSTRLKEDNSLFQCMKKTLKRKKKNKGWMWCLPYIYWLGVRALGAGRYNNG